MVTEEIYTFEDDEETLEEINKNDEVISNDDFDFDFESESDEDYEKESYDDESIMDEASPFVYLEDE